MDFVYADPPYDVEFTAVLAGRILLGRPGANGEWLSRHRGPVILVNQATERVAALYKDLGFSVCYLDAPRRISCTGDRTPAKEVMATRNL